MHLRGDSCKSVVIYRIWADIFICIFTMFCWRWFITEHIAVLVHICVIIMSKSEETTVKNDVLDMQKNNEKNACFGMQQTS